LGENYGQKKYKKKYEYKGRKRKINEKWEVNGVEKI
jgi:hypothetical protein